MFRDWHVFVEAVTVLLAGGNPYTVPLYYNPVWTLPLFVPFVLLGEPYGKILYTLFSYLAFAFVAWRMRASPLAFGAFLFALPVISSVIFINLDWLPMLALVVPPPLALIFALSKPQLGIILALYLVYDAYRRRRLIKTVSPFAVIALLSVVLYGLPRVGVLSNADWNLSLFPMLIPFGIALAFLAIYHHRPLATFPASLMLAPYVGYSSYSGVYVALLRHQWLMLAACLALWTWRILSQFL